MFPSGPKFTQHGDFDSYFLFSVVVVAKNCNDEFCVRVLQQRQCKYLLKLGCRVSRSDASTPDTSNCTTNASSPEKMSNTSVVLVSSGK